MPSRMLDPSGRFRSAGTIILATAVIFAFIAFQVAVQGPVIGVDERFARWLQQHSNPGIMQLMFFITSLASVPVVAALGFVSALWFSWRRQWRQLAVLIVALCGGKVASELLKILFARARPSVQDAYPLPATYSFPSGHAVDAVLLYGLLTLFWLQSNPSNRTRHLGMIAICLLILLIGFSRLYLGVHFLSDVLGGFAFALAWLVISLAAVRLVWSLLTE